MPTQIYLLLCAMLWGWTFVATKTLLSYVTPPEVIGIRLAIALPILYLLMRLKGVTLEFSLADKKAMAAGAAILGLHWVIQFTGLQYTSATNTAWLIAIVPLVLAFLSFILLGERLGRREVAGIVVASAGIVLLVSRGHVTSLGWLTSVGDWLVVVSTFTWAFYTIVTRGVLARRHPLAVTFGVLLPVGIGAIAYMLITSDPSRLTGMPLSAKLAALYLGIFAQAIALWFWQEGVAKIGAARAGLFLYLEPLATMALAIPVLGESFSWATGIGGAFVLAGVFYAQHFRVTSPTE